MRSAKGGRTRGHGYGKRTGECGGAPLMGVAPYRELVGVEDILGDVVLGLLKDILFSIKQWWEGLPGPVRTGLVLCLVAIFAVPAIWVLLDSEGSTQESKEELVHISGSDGLYHREDCDLLGPHPDAYSKEAVGQRAISRVRTARKARSRSHSHAAQEVRAEMPTSVQSTPSAEAK